ncbi:MULTISPECIES: thiol:disulfide interchange protein TlpA [unclassified Mesorhizobium]|uniref:thiol:disulfide interchange protein TlpA n=1 Tax=unclassified Mesorhizobium TaxID=325217 RepID=UPI000F75A39D|nr:MULTISPECIES: TlpA disulfide reductase family protein [unclassified Mesorhizobium]AZO66006.1 TlpA family protein disulfide reductase [Mesorhizobium sp. M6A.T.Cr.TU.016.01.1.1]RWP50612.1 MAG: redoxin domain-containing protein [Mesorhizobium sp.]RWP54402.1 MAG: redoxin domain-containing protein [Mesorhizobium sp.]RWQ71420.1 MAG: redoxin domain-containing protein [Mesorhizobium sp.]
MADGNRFFPAPRLILAALVAGVLVGAVAVYVSESGSGNNAPAQVAVGDSEDDAACTAKADRAKTVAAAATGQVAALLPADPPQSLKSLAFNDPAGKPMTLADHAGKTVLLNLWATWCAPCRAEMPALDALQKEMGSDAFEVVAVNVDVGDDTKPKKFLEETGVTSLGYYRDSTMALFNDLKTRGLALGLPVTMLIDGEGCLIAHMNGPAEWSGPDAKRLVETALAKSD